MDEFFCYAFFTPNDFYKNNYDNGIAVFNKNEENALQLFSIIEASSPDKIIEHIDNVGLPAWKNNIELLDNLVKIDGLYGQLKKQNEILRQYSKLRIETFGLIKIAIKEDTNGYDKKIEELNQ